MRALSELPGGCGGEFSGRAGGSEQSSGKGSWGEVSAVIVIRHEKRQKKRLRVEKKYFTG